MLLLRVIREHLQLTQQELARAARVSQPTISQIELGRVNPSDDEVASLAAALVRLAAAAELERHAAELRQGRA